MVATARPDQRPQSAVPALVAAAAMGLAIAAALATRSGAGLATGVEGASAATSNWLEGVSAALPFGYAFGAGMVSAVNPCGFAMLPGYVGYYLGQQEQASTLSRLGRALWISALVTAGFLILFGSIGMALGAASSLLVRLLPWLGLAVGIALVVVGARLIRGDTLYLRLGERLADRLGSDARRASARGYFAYGLAYGAASISCTLPVFLGVIGGTGPRPASPWLRFRCSSTGWAWARSSAL